MSEVTPLRPLYNQTQVVNGVVTQQGGLMPSVTLAATASSQATAQFPGNADENSVVQIRIANTGTTWAYINFGRFGNIAAATVAAGFPVGPGAVETVTVDPEVSGATVILASGTGNVTFTRGEGV